MDYKQDVTPNLDPTVSSDGVVLTDWYEWCLATVETAFGTPRLYPTAWAAWEAATIKHQDQNWPIGVYFPIWFSGAGGDGHVAFAYVNSNGSMGIWTSPYEHVPYFYTGYGSVAALADGYHVTYVGWSEDLSGIRLIEPAAPPYTVTPITPKQVLVGSGMHEWNLSLATFDDVDNNPFTTAGDNHIITAVATLVRPDFSQYTYYLEDVSSPIGWNTLDCTDYTAPVVIPPTPPPSPANITSPVTAPNKTPYKVVADVPTFSSVTDATNHTNPTGSLEPSNIKYYQFNQLNGMVAITTTPGLSQGIWINPADNVVVPVVVPETSADVRASYKRFFPTNDPLSYRIVEDYVVKDMVYSGKPVTIYADHDIEIYGTFMVNGHTYLRPAVSEEDAKYIHYYYGIPTTDVNSGAPYLENLYDVKDRILYGWEKFYDKVVQTVEGIFHPKKVK